MRIAYILSALAVGMSTTTALAQYDANGNRAADRALGGYSTRSYPSSLEVSPPLGKELCPGCREENPSDARYGGHDPGGKCKSYSGH